MIPVLAYAPRPTPLGCSSALAASVQLGAFAVLAFAFSSPIVLGALLLAVVAAGIAAGARRQVVASLRAALVLGVLLIAVNALVAGRGETILVRGWDLPLLGQTDLTLEAIVAGAVTALRLAVVIVAFAVHSAVVDPDRLLRGLRPLARRSAMTATLIARMVPLAAADHARLREAAELRGPAAAPAGRTRVLRRLVAGALDRAVETAATLELRGYSRGVPRAVGRRRRGPDDGLFVASGLAVIAIGAVALVAGWGGFVAYPAITADVSAPTLALAAAMPALALAPVAGSRLRRRRLRSPLTPRPAQVATGGTGA